jgi:hypothetical protein
MNKDIAQLVREGLDELTDGATVPPGLAARARRQHHLRNAAIGSAVTATAAAVAVIAVVAASLATAPVRGRTGSANLDAAIISRAEQALDARSADVVQASSSSPVNGTTLRVMSWSDGAGNRTQLAVTGQPAQAAGYVLHRGSVTFVTVDYRTRTWQQMSLPDAKLPSRAVPAAVAPIQIIFAKELQSVTGRCAAAGRSRPDFITFSWAAYIRHMLGCGVLKVAGHGTVDGRAATKLVATGLAQVPYSAVLWIGRSGYLPLRLAFVPLNAAAGPFGMQIDLRWLPPTRANLAKAAILPAPPGFKQTRWGS